MLLLGETWTADQAHVYGLVTKVFEPDALLAGAQQVAESLSVGVSSAAIVVSALLLEPCRPALTPSAVGSTANAPSASTRS